MRISNSLIVCYKKPESNRILEIMQKNDLFKNDKLLKNVEKVIPVSKVLRCLKNKKITSIFFEKKGDKILFYIYI